MTEKSSSNTTPALRPAFEPDRQELLSLLDSEINHIQNEQRRGGWNLWSLTVAFAVSFWMLLELIASRTVNWIPSLQIAIALIITMDISRSLIALLGYRREVRKGRRRYLWSHGFSNTRPSIVFMLIRVGLLVTCGLVASRGIPLIPVAFLSVFYLTLLVILAVALVRTYQPVLLNREDKAPLKGQVIGQLVAMAVMGWTLFLFAKQGAIGSGRIDGQACQAGALAAASMVTLEFASGMLEKPPLIDILVSLRRDLVLKQTSLPAVTRQVDIALSGLRIEDVAQERLASVLGQVRKLQAQQKAIRDDLEVLKPVVDSLKHGKVELEKSVVNEARSRLETFGNGLTNLESFTEELQRAADKFQRDMLGYGSASKSIRLRQPEILKSVSETVSQRARETRELVDEAKAIVKVIATSLNLPEISN